MGLYPDDEDDLIPRVARPSANDATAPATLRGLGAVGSTEDLESRGAASKTLPKPAEPSPLQQRTTADQAELSRLQTTGSGISQIKNPVGRYALRGLETVGNFLMPRNTAMIPGTEGHHNQLIARQQGLIGEDLGEQQKQATVEHTGAETEQAESAAERDRAEAQAKLNPQPKEGLTPEETTIHDLMTGENGGPRLNPQTGKPFTYLEAFTAVAQAKQDTKPDKPDPKLNDFEHYYADWLKDNQFPDTAHNRLLARSAYAKAGQTPQRDQQQLIVTPDGTIVEAKPGMKIAPGSKTVNGDLAGSKPNAEELKRSEMAENMNENLAKLEDIVKRRPDLFGPMAGRITQGKMWLGSNDEDIGALNTIKDQIGMAQQSAHSMRSAQHVEAAAAAILNGFKNGPDAINSSIKTARDSLKTFTNDVQQGNPSTRKEGAGAPHTEKTTGPLEYKPGLVRNGYKFKGGDPTKQENWEQVAK